MELMVVIAIIALLATMTLMGFRYAQTMAMRNRTTAFSKSLASGLTKYHTEWGEYPRPKRPAQTSTFPGGKTYNVGAALMLYQAMTGNGDTEIELASSVLGASKAKTETADATNVMINEMPPEMAKKDTTGWLMVDGFGHPFQYQVPNVNTKTAYGVAASKAEQQTVNTTYDLWSYGEDDKHTNEASLEAKKNDTTSAKWIKNW